MAHLITSSSKVDNKLVNMRMPVDLLNKLDMIAAQTNMSRSKVIRTILEAWLEEDRIKGG